MPKVRPTYTDTVT